MRDLNAHRECYILHCLCGLANQLKTAAQTFQFEQTTRYIEPENIFSLTPASETDPDPMHNLQHFHGLYGVASEYFMFHWSLLWLTTKTRREGTPTVTWCCQWRSSSNVPQHQPTPKSKVILSFSTKHFFLLLYFFLRLTLLLQNNLIETSCKL